MINKSKVIGLMSSSISTVRFQHFGLLSLLYIYLKNNVPGSRILHFMTIHLFIILNSVSPLVEHIIFKEKTRTDRYTIFYGILYLIGFIMLFIHSLNIFSNAILYIGLILISVGSGLLKTLLNICEPYSRCICQFPYFPTHFLYYILYIISILSSIWAPIISGFVFIHSIRPYTIYFFISSFLIFGSMYLYSSLHRYSECKKNLHHRLELFINYYVRKLQIFKAQKQNIEESNGREMDNLKGQKEDMEKTAHVFTKFIPISFYWAMNDLQYSFWMEQSTEMVFPKGNIFHRYPFSPYLVNGIVFVLFLPLFTIFIYPYLKPFLYPPNYHKKISISFFIASISFFISIAVECISYFHKKKISIFIQIPQYLLLLVSDAIMEYYGFSRFKNQLPSSLLSLSPYIWFLYIAMGNMMLVSVFLIMNFFIDFSQLVSKILFYSVWMALGIYMGVYFLNLNKT